MASLLSMLRSKLFGGTPGPDTLTGTDQADVLRGYGGPDSIDSRGGNDWIAGGSGDDRLIGGDGSDHISGGSGNDIIFGDQTDPVFSGGGDDWIWGGAGDDTISGGLGSNTIDGGSGNDTIFATWENFAAAELGGPATINGGSGDDHIFGTYAADVLRGGSGNDTIFGFEGNDLIQGGAGDDELVWGNTMAPGGLGTLEGGSGNDVLRGGLVNGNMFGGTGDDTLILGRFNPGPFDAAPPVIDGGRGFDTLNIALRPSFDITGVDGQNLSGIEKIDMTGGAPSGQELVLSMASLLGLSNTTNTLLVAGDAADHITAQGVWLAGGGQTIDGIQFNQWTSGNATLLAQSDMSVSFA